MHNLKFYSTLHLFKHEVDFSCYYLANNNDSDDDGYDDDYDANDGGQNNHRFVGSDEEDGFLWPRAHIFCASSIKQWRKGSFADFCWNERKRWQKHHWIISHEQKVDRTLQPP